jgi:hypothetical protein
MVNVVDALHPETVFNPITVQTPGCVILADCPVSVPPADVQVNVCGLEFPTEVVTVMGVFRQVKV